MKKALLAAVVGLAAISIHPSSSAGAPYIVYDDGAASTPVVQAVDPISGQQWTAFVLGNGAMVQGDYMLQENGGSSAENPSDLLRFANINGIGNVVFLYSNGADGLDRPMDVANLPIGYDWIANNSGTVTAYGKPWFFTKGMSEFGNPPSDVFTFGYFSPAAGQAGYIANDTTSYTLSEAVPLPPAVWAGMAMLGAMWAFSGIKRKLASR
jgi:hypothetical protein